MIDDSLYNEAISTYNLGVKYLDKSRYDKALPHFKKALKVWEFKEAHLNAANSYKAMGNDTRARDHYLKANDIRIPHSSGKFFKDYDLALNNLGLMAYKYENDNEAALLLQAALDAKNPSLKEEDTSALFNLAVCRLRQYCSGKYFMPDVAWRLYRARFHSGANPTRLKNDKADLREWNGFDTVDSLVVLSEQGFGDSLMFARYLPYLRKFAKKIWVQCDPSANGLFSGEYLPCFSVTGTDATHGVAFGDLPMHLLMDIPDGVWLPSGSVSSNVEKIGCVWSGNSKHANDDLRSTLPGYFKKYLGEYSLYTLNPREHGTRGFTALKTDTWVDTLKSLNLVDVVVTVDTSIAHLCGASGKKCYVMMPLANTDFRWGDSSMGTSNLWYDSVKVIRNPNDWDATFMKVVNELKNN